MDVLYEHKGIRIWRLQIMVQSSALCLLFSVVVFAPCVSSLVPPAVYIKGDSRPNVNRDGETIAITPSQTYEIFCDGEQYAKHWYKVNDESESSITRLSREINSPDVYAINTGSFLVTLQFKPFQTTHAGEYECRFSSNGNTQTTLSVFITPAPTPPSPPSKVQGVTVTRTVQGSSPALRVSWSAVSGSGITYTVCYSTTSGTQSDPPSNADCSTSEIPDTSTTLGPLSRGTIYYIWVAAVSSDGRGPYSDRASAVIDPRIYTNDVSEGKVNLKNGATLTITPSITYDIWCSDTNVKDWYRVRDGSSISRYGEYTNKGSTPDVYATNPGGNALALHVKSFQSADSGEYECRLRSGGLPTLSIHLTPAPTPPPPPIPSKVRGVTVTKTVQGSSPALRVSWRAVSGSGITYTVCYSTTSGTQSDPPSNANCGTSGITGTSTTLRSLSRGTTYYIWVRAVSSGVRGPYSDRRQTITYDVPKPVVSLQVKSFPTMFRLIITWGPPSDSNYPTPVTYQLRYRERPPSGPGGWSITVQRTATNRQYTTPVLKPGTRYEVEVWAVSSLGNGQSISRTASTLQLPGPVTSLQVRPSTTIFGLIITWEPPSGSNYPTPVTYQLKYWESPPSESPGGWSSTVRRTATQRQYTTPVLKPGTRYEVEVWPLFNMDIKGSYIRGAARTASGSVRELNVTAHSSQLSLMIAWRRPAVRTNFITYKLRYRKTDSEDMWSNDRTIMGSQQMMYTIEHLDARVTYEVEVWAVFDSGEGNRSIGSATVGGKPSVTIRVESVNTSSITVVTRGSQGNLSYREVGSRDIPMTLIMSNSMRAVISKLKPNTGYRIIYSEANNYGTSRAVTNNFTLSEAPSRLKLRIVSSKSIEITWNPPLNNQSLRYYINYTKSLAKPTTNESPTLRDIVSTTINITDLHPYEEYTISVQAGNRAGLSVPVSGTARTYSDSPTAKPIGRAPAAVSSRWCLLTWQIPDKEGRNGVIEMYIIKLEEKIQNATVSTIPYKLMHFNFSSPENLDYNVTNLAPFTTYKWRVAAATVNGTGPYDQNKCQTAEDVPGPVSNLNYNVTSATSAMISWSSPLEPNGDITEYSLRYTSLSGNASEEIEHNTKNAQISKIQITTEIHTPYEVTVTAKTSAGFGEPSSLILFTAEGVPTKTVENVVAYRVDSERVDISWTPLSYVEARGFPLYNVSYMSGGDQVGSVNTKESSVIIRGLSSYSTYTFTIRVLTGNGTGEATAPVTLLGKAPPAEGGSPASAVAAAVAVFLIIIIVAIIAICIVVYCRRRQKAAAGTSAMMPVHCEKKGKNEYTLGIDSGGKTDVDSILGELPVMADGGQKVITRKSFLAVTKQLHFNRDRGFEEEFKTIVNDPNGSDVIAKGNRRKNRYGNITTYDHCRVVLSVPDENGSDYINASYINGYAIENAYIASQGPTPNTVSDFWQMLWDQKCPVIVMLTKVEEKGKKKCHQYWEDELLKPYEPGGGLEVTVTSVKGYANYEVREITLSNPSSGRTKPHKLKQFHYTGWPDHGVPTHPSSLVKFAQQVRREYRDSTAPLLVHCSAGVGRTGTFITIDAMLERLQEKDNLNIYQFVTAMRTRRTFMVQTMEQYAFIHDALCDYLMCGDTSVAAHELRMEIQSLHQADAKTRKSGFQQQFELLDSVSKKPVSEDESFSRKAAVVKKNRYKDKFPYSNCYVRAPGKGPTGGADYMNASYIDSYSRNKAFIAAQAPLESTKSDVWEMIWQFRPSTVVVLCDFQKERQEACSRFWPDEREKTLNVGFLKVNNECTERDATYDITKLEVFDSRKESSKVLHVSLFHLKDWDKEGSPTTEAVLRLMGDVQNTTASPSGDVIPAVVMCDDGMGRSGVFICAMSEVERVKVEGQVDVFQTIKGMRIQRPHMVETADQYKLCFEILQSYLDSFDTYANFKAV